MAVQQLERLVGSILVLLLLTENGSSAFRHSIQFSSRPATISWRRGAVNGDADDFASSEQPEKNSRVKGSSLNGAMNGASANGASVNGAKVNGAFNGKVNGAVNGKIETSSRIPTRPASYVVDVVLFGVGDLRVDDHIGLKRACADSSSSTSSVVLPLFLLEPQQLAQIPGASAHTADTAQLLAAALQDLDASLQDELGLNLVVEWVNSEDDENGWEDIVVQAVKQQQEGQDDASSSIEEIRVHVCDLGTVDNEMGYGAYSKFLHKSSPTSASDIPISVIPWHQNLREEPWEEVQDLPDRYPEYESNYAASSEQEPIKPFDVSSVFFDASQRAYVSQIKENIIPKHQQIQQAMTDQLSQDPARVQAEQRSGLYATHWGGLAPETVGSRRALDTLTTYTQDCLEDDLEWDQHPSYIDRHCKRNGRSLEHAAMAWQLRGDGTSPAGNPQNWLAGESMVRFLAAPLLLGTISPRRVWHSSQTRPFLFKSPLKNMVEGREWHRLLAARSTLLQRQEQPKTVYKYWRYHGFLCRYAQTELESQNAVETAASSKEGILLVHGFGASGAQWDKVMQELASELQTTATATKNSGKTVVSQEGLAPDMLGFGHSEKPAISYTGYLWDAMMLDFVKDVAQPKHGWNSFVAGGNSIGGFTSMSMAASDMATISGHEVCSSGAPGTNSCTGLVLMNTAGPVESPAQVKKQPFQKESAAQALARDGLPPCQPPPRPLSRIFGHALMSYLRPRIGSICTNLYPTNPAAVDEKLCETIHRDSLDPGAIHVMMAGSKLPPPRTANEMLAGDFGGTAPVTSLHGSLPESVFTGPVLVAQGVLDPLNDAKGRMETFGALRAGIETAALQAGHCPHDEVPSHVAQSVAAWLSRSRTARQARLQVQAEVEEPVVTPTWQADVAVWETVDPLSSSLKAGATNMTLSTS